MNGKAMAVQQGAHELAEIYKALRGGSIKLHAEGSQKFIRAIGSKPAFTEAMESMTSPAVDMGARVTDKGKTVLDVLIKDGETVCMDAKAELQVPAGKEEGFFEAISKLFSKKEGKTMKKPKGGLKELPNKEPKEAINEMTKSRNVVRTELGLLKEKKLTPEESEQLIKSLKIKA